MARIVVPDDFPSIFSGSGALPRLQAAAEVKIYTDKAASPEELIERPKDAEVAINIRAYTKFTEPLLRSCPQLKLIAVLGVGADNIDVAAASRLGIRVCNTPGYSAVSVAEHALSLMLAAARKIPQHEQELRAGRWTRLPMVQLHGRILGVLGFGNIGRQMAALAKGIGMRVWAWTLHPDPRRAAEAGTQLVGLETLLAQSDVVSIHLAASTSTRCSINRETLAKMKPSCILVNTARASIVDTPALVEALKTGRLAAAALDVYDQEPLPAGDPFLSLPNVVLSPHNAGMTPEAIARGNEMAIENVLSFLHGHPINLVN